MSSLWWLFHPRQYLMRKALLSLLPRFGARMTAMHSEVALAEIRALDADSAAHKARLDRNESSQLLNGVLERIAKVGYERRPHDRELIASVRITEPHLWAMFGAGTVDDKAMAAVARFLAVELSIKLKQAAGLIPHRRMDSTEPPPFCVIRDERPMRPGDILPRQPWPF